MKCKITFIALLLSVSALMAQNIEFTFANTAMTNDGVDDFYETDVMIATIDGLADFKLGSGLLYINYSTAAFGSNISGSGAALVTYPNPNYILGDSNVFGYYTGFLPADNSASRFAFSFQQFLSSGGMVDNVTSTPKKLFHLKIKFMDSGMDPMVAFEDNETQPPGVNDCRDQFYTACGPSGSLAGANCGSEPGTQFQDAIFTSTGAVLSVENKLLTGLSIYPNPTKGMLYLKGDISQLKAINIYSFTGQHVMEVKSNFEAIDLRKLQSAIYFVKLDSEEASATLKIVKK